jgi:hypothetical protein
MGWRREPERWVIKEIEAGYNRWLFPVPFTLLTQRFPPRPALLTRLKLDPILPLGPKL